MKIPVSLVDLSFLFIFLNISDFLSLNTSERTHSLSEFFLK
jgi:hypothetical protein